MSDISILIVSNLVIFVAVSIIIWYLVHRDTVRQSIMDKRQDSIIQGLIEDVTKNQATYKQEIINEVKELTIATTNILIGVERVVSGVEKFADINTKSVAKVAANVEEVSEGVKGVIIEVDRVAEEVTKVAKEVNRVVCEVEKVTKGLKELSKKMNGDIENGNIILSDKNDKLND